MSKNVQAKLAEILRLWKDAAGNIQKIATLYVALTNEDPDIDAALIREGVPMWALELWEDIGTGRLHPDAALEPYNTRSKLLDLPLKEQESVIKAPIPVVKERDGKQVVEYKRLAEMSGSERNQAIGVSVEGQKEFLNETKKLKKLNQQAFIATPRGVQFLDPSRVYTWDELEEIKRRTLAHVNPMAEAATLERELKKRQVA